MTERPKDEQQAVETRRDSLPTTAFATLQELTRHGYAPAPEVPASATDLLLRHPAAPDLILKEDGTLTVPLDQAHKPRAAAVLQTAKRIYWGRGCLFLSVLSVVTFLGFMLFVALTAN